MPTMIDEAKAEEALARAAVTNRQWAIFQTLFFAVLLAVFLAQPWARRFTRSVVVRVGFVFHCVCCYLL
jgi:hypothetical protein